MKNKIFILTFLALLLFPLISILPQNEDESPRKLTSQEIDNKTFELTLEAIRSTFSVDYDTTECTIGEAEGSDVLSDVIDLGDNRLIAIIMPSAWTAATITFQASKDGVTFKDVILWDGGEIEYTVDVDQWIIVEPIHFAGMKFIKIRSGTSATPVSQLAERTIELVTRGY